MQTCISNQPTNHPVQILALRTMAVHSSIGPQRKQKRDRNANMYRYTEWWGPAYLPVGNLWCCAFGNWGPSCLHTCLMYAMVAAAWLVEDQQRLLKTCSCLEPCDTMLDTSVYWHYFLAAYLGLAWRMLTQQCLPHAINKTTSRTGASSGSFAKGTSLLTYILLAGIYKGAHTHNIVSKF